MKPELIESTSTDAPYRPSADTAARRQRLYLGAPSLLKEQRLMYYSGLVNEMGTAHESQHNVAIKAALSPIERIRARQEKVRQRALELQQEHGDPVENLANLLGDIGLSDKEWDTLTDEPYQKGGRCCGQGRRPDRSKRPHPRSSSP